MRIVCPNCNYTREIDSARIPKGVVRASCPQCQHRFILPSGPESGPEPPPPIEEVRSRSDLSAPEPAPAAPARPPLPPPGMPRFQQATAGYGPGTGAGFHSGIDWETRPSGFFQNLYTTTWEVLFHPGDFYERMARTGGYKGPLIYGLILGCLGWVVSIFWQLLLTMAGVAIKGGSNETSLLIQTVVFLGLMVFSPLFVALGLLVAGVVQHLLLMIVDGADGGFEATFRVLAYAQAPQIFAIVPILGGMVAWVWSAVLIVIGMSKAHETGIGRVIVALIVIPFGLMFLLVLIALIVVLLVL